ncbi:MAG: MarR family transcriptional regulator [Pseudomonadota bacterium]
MSDRLTIDSQLCFSLYSTSLAMTQFYKGLLEPLGLTYAQYIVMLVLWEQDGVTLTHIADKLDQQSGALTPVLKRIEALGLLQRNRNPENERELQVFLTRKGKAMRTKALEINQCVADACGLGESELTDLHKNIDDLRAQLKKYIAQ